MAIGILNSSGSAVTMKSSTIGGEHVPHHQLQSSVIDSNNSTTSVLAADAAYTGTGVDCRGFSEVVVSIAASHDSAASGISLQFSSDNTNWDHVRTHTMDVSENADRVFRAPVLARYFRLVYTNGSTLQTHFRVQTILHTGAVGPVVQRLGSDTPADFPGAVGRSAVMARTTTAGADFVDVKASDSGNLKVSVEEQAALPTGSNVVGKVDINSNAQASTVVTGQETVAATEIQFNSGTSKAPIGKVLVKALTTNSGIVYVGTTGLSTSTGYALEAGDKVEIDIDDVNKLYHIGTASDKLTWLCNTA